MIIKLQRKNLLDALMIGAQFTGKSKNLPILNNIKVDIKQKEAFITSSDSYNTIKVSFNDAIIEKDVNTDDFSFLLDVKDFISYIKNINDDDIILNIDEQDNKILLQHSKGKANYPIFDVEGFPTINIEKGMKAINVETDTLLSWINKGKAFIATEDLRPTMTGIYLYVKDNEMGVCATDAYSLFYNYQTIDTTDKENECIINNNIIPALLNMLSMSEENIDIKVGEKNIMFSNNRIKLMGRLIEGKFPAFKSILPKDNSIEVKLFKDDIIGALNRVICVGNKTTKMIIINISNNKVTLTSQDMDFNLGGEEEISCNSNGNLTIGAKYDNIIKALNVLDTNNIIINMKDEQKPIVFHDNSGDNKLSLIMPMKINEK